MSMDPRIGVMNSGKFYCFPQGYDQPELAGTLQEVGVALGLRQDAVETPSRPAGVRPRMWNVRLKFQYPAWGEANGIEYPAIQASGRAEANRIARRLADRDGHLGSGNGLATFAATEVGLG